MSRLSLDSPSSAGGTSRPEPPGRFPTGFRARRCAATTCPDGSAFFLYTRDPDGHRIELYTSDYYTGDPDLKPLRWSATDPMRGTFWGHLAPRSWFEESSLLAAEDGGTVPTLEPALPVRTDVAS